MCARSRKLSSGKWKNPIIEMKYSAAASVPNLSAARCSIRAPSPL
jgi:hypothetical protein